MRLHNLALFVILVASRALACQGLVETLSNCEKYSCEYSDALSSKDSSVHVVGKLPDGCRYIELTEDSIMECTFPYEDLDKRARSYFLNQSNVSIVQANKNYSDVRYYCKFIAVKLQSKYTSKFTRAFDELQKHIKQQGMRPLFMTEDQADQLARNLKKIS